MIRKGAVLILLTLLSFHLQGQYSTIEPGNPAPRVGEHVEFQINLQKYPSTSDDDSEEQSVIKTDNRFASGFLKLHKTVADTGRMTIGPFEFNFGDASFKTEVITIHVIPALPDDVTDGLWLRIVPFKEISYLILEQRISNKWKRDPKDPSTITLATDELLFAGLNEEKLNASGIEIISRNVSTSNQQLNKKSGNKVVNAGYQISTFKIKKTEFFRGPLKIDRSYFTDLPKGIIESVTIN